MPEPGFADDVARVVHRLRSAVAAAVEHAPGGQGRAIDLQRSLDLDAALAWQLHTLATSEDAIRAARVVPKAGAMERFCRAARGSAAPEALCRELADAYAAFEQVVEDHAGDRSTFDAMVSALCPDDGSALRRLRRAAFRADAAVWGVSVRCVVNCVIFNQRPTGEHDCLAIRSRLGVRRLQEGAVIGIYASGRTWGGGTCPPEGAKPVAVDRCELLDEYCSTPIPRIERVPAPDGSVRELLHLDGLGRTREISVTWRNLSLGFPGGTTSPPHGATTPCTQPAEVIVADLLLPRGWTDPRTAQVLVTESGPLSGPGVGAQRLPFEGAVEHLGSGVEAMFTRHAPQHAEIVAHELSRLGWNHAAFDVYRCVVRYPVLNAAVHVFVDGPRGGEGARPTPTSIL